MTVRSTRVFYVSRATAVGSDRSSNLPEAGNSQTHELSHVYGCAASLILVSVSRPLKPWTKFLFAIPTSVGKNMW